MKDSSCAPERRLYGRNACKRAKQLEQVHARMRSRGDGGADETGASPLNWAVLGCGVIANEMAAALKKMGKRLYGVGNRTHEKAVEFAPYIRRGKGV